MIEFGYEPDAKRELREAIDYYDSKKAGLGGEFLAEVERAIEFLRTFPDASPAITPRSRRCRTARFPYGLIYQVVNGCARILSVMHLRRQPGYWLDREIEE